MKVKFSVEDGMNHLDGSGICGHETACGNVDTFGDYKTKNGIVNCAGCLDVAESIFSQITKKQLKEAKESA